MGIIIDKKKTIIILIIGIISGSLSTINAIISDIEKKNLNIKNQLVELTNAANKELPKMIDSETRYDSVIVLGNKTLQFNYTIINYSKDELDINELRDDFYSRILDNIKMNFNQKSLKDNKIKMIYIINDKDDHKIIELVFDRNVYGK